MRTYPIPSRLRRSGLKSTTAALSLAITTVLGGFVPPAQALNTGTDLNLSLLPIAGGMAGAAYTHPQEVGAAIFGNPATLSLFKGYNFEIGAGLLEPNVDNTQSNRGYGHSSTSSARNYIVPSFAASGEVLPGFVVAAGIGVDSGLGTNYKTSPINAGAGLGLGGGGVGGAATLPLLDELLSFSGNLGAAWAVTPDWSLGASLTLGFGLAQLGTSGNTTGLQGLTGNFGGTTSSEHDISVRGAVGTTYKVAPDWTISAGVKSPLEYTYQNILATTVNGYDQYQTAKITQPLEVTWGFSTEALEGVLLEADVAWKNWSNADLYKDIYQDQFLAMFGGQYAFEGWQFRGGYSYASPVLLNNPNGTISEFSGIGTLPFNTAVPGVLNQNDLVKVVQTSLAPVVWQNTLTAGLGYAFTQNFRLDGYGAYAFSENADRTTLALGNYHVTASEWAIGLGANFKF